jgi:hypothetical protein
MQPADTHLVLQLLQHADRRLVGILSNQQQQQQQTLLQLLQELRCMLDGFTALQGGMAAQPAAVRSKARFAQHEQQQPQAGWDSFTLNWDICSGEHRCAASQAVDVHLPLCDWKAHLGGIRTI